MRKTFKVITFRVKTTQDTVTNTDVLYIKKNLHRARSSILPNLPKTKNDVRNVLNKIEVTYENEKFLLQNGLESGIGSFSTKNNHEFLIKIDTYYVYGTFQYCTKYFCQLPIYDPRVNQ